MAIPSESEVQAIQGRKYHMAIADDVRSDKIDRRRRLAAIATSFLLAMTN